jgi:hypothetical protein
VLDFLGGLTLERKVVWFSGSTCVSFFMNSFVSIIPRIRLHFFGGIGVP